MPVDIRDTVGSNIKAEMVRRGVTQEQMAEALGITQGQVSRRLTGDIALTVVDLGRIADLLGVTASSLFTPVVVAA